MIRHALLLAFCFSVLQAHSFQNINAFVYHRFGDDRYPSTNIDLDKFEAHLKYLSENEYEVISMAEVVKRLDKKREKDSKIAVITIDDGFKSFYQNGLPLLVIIWLPCHIICQYRNRWSRRLYVLAATK